MDKSFEFNRYKQGDIKNSDFVTKMQAEAEGRSTELETSVVGLSTELNVISSNPNLSIRNDYTGVKDLAGFEYETLTYIMNDVPESTTLSVVSSNPNLTIRNDYSGTKEEVGVETLTLTCAEKVNYYAWVAGDTVYYTKNKPALENEEVYNAEKSIIGKVISCEGDNIEVEELTEANWYAWVNNESETYYAWNAGNGRVFYLASSIPVVGDHVYNELKEDTGLVVLSVSADSITIGSEV